MNNSNKIIFIALDGADKDLMLEWAAAGVLPNIRLLLQRATWCTVDNPPALFAGSVWPSFYTGVSPAKHGKYCSHQLKCGTYEFRRTQGFDPRCATLWDVLSRQAKKVAIIDAPKSVVSEGLNGIQVVDWATEDFDIDLATWPPDLIDKIERDYGRNEVIEMAVASEGYPGLERLRDTLRSRLRSKLRMSEDILARDHWDFFFTLLTEIHTAGHLCWHLHDENHPRHDAQQARRIGDIVRDIYVATDAALEKFIAMAGPNTHVIIYSVNGMGASHTGNHLLDDVLMALDRNRLPAFRRGLTSIANWIDRKTPARIYDSMDPIQRGMRRALSLPVRDLSLRTAFRVPSNSIAGGVRINLAGREPAGIVRPDDYRTVCVELQRVLSSLVDAATRNPLTKRVILTHDHFAGEYLNELPDLLVEWTQESPVSHVWSPATGSVHKEYQGHRTGDHRPDGVLFLLGPGQGRGEIDSVSLYDIAPTLAGLLGAPFPDADGVDASIHLGIGANR